MVIQHQDELTRFIRPKQKDFVTKDGQVRTAAFSIDDTGSISVFVTSSMLLNEIWVHGDTYFPHPIIGRAYFQANIVFDERLSIDFDNDPPRHANITGFPSDKDSRLARRQALAANAYFNER